GRPPPTKSAGRRPACVFSRRKRSIRSSSDEQPMGSVESLLVAERHGGPFFWHALRTVRDVRPAERYFLKPKRFSLDTCGCAVQLESSDNSRSRPMTPRATHYPSREACLGSS